MSERSLRIGITGSACTGKTSLVNALGERLGLTVVGEEMREFLVAEAGSPAGGLSALPVDERRRALEGLFARRVERERELESFVADNTSLDFMAYALHHGIYDELGSTANAPLLSEPARVIGSYDAIFVLPQGALPYIEDGVRSDHALAELRYQHLVESTLRRSFAPHRTHLIPTECKELEERVRHMVLVLERRGLLEAPSERAIETKTGEVYLVGAGPGDPDLLTVRARHLLQEADVVAPDKLVPTELLETLRHDVEVIQVGHRGRGSRIAAHRIHPAVLEAARAGKRVVRLKTGDPMIFGRGAEEAEELRAAGIPFEIVPGISAALGAAAYAGIPLTHRDHASDVTFATGHESSSDRPSRTFWAGVGAGAGTVVLYMAAQRLESSLAQLVEAGRAPSTPAAYVAGATHISQTVIVGTLSDLAERAQHEDRSRPAIVIVGEVVNQRKSAAWIEARRPLLGRSLLVARARSGSSRLAAELRSLGARVVESPIVEDKHADAAQALAQALRLRPTAVVVGDATVSRFLRLAAGQLSPTDRDQLLGLPTLALTKSAAADRHEHGLDVDITARGSCIDALREVTNKLFGTHRGRVLIAGERRGRPTLSATLHELGFETDDVIVFERDYRFPRGDVSAFDAAVFPSSSAVRAVFDDTLSEQWLSVPAVSIGPETSAALRQAGVRWIEEAIDDTVEASIARTIQVLTAPSRKEAVLQ